MAARQTLRHAPQPRRRMQAQLKRMLLQALLSAPLDRAVHLPILAAAVGTLPQVAGSCSHVKPRFSCKYRGCK